MYPVPLARENLSVSVEVAPINVSTPKSLTPADSPGVLANDITLFPPSTIIKSAPDPATIKL